jgi:hypothetical protein
MTTKKAAAKKPAKASVKTSAKSSAKSSVKSSAKVGAKSPVKSFRALVERKEGSAVCSIHFPFDVEKTFGARGHVPVRGTLNGTPFRSSIFKMGGRHFMVVNRKLREASGVSGGETVPVRIERDTEPRVVNPPADFARALKANREAQAAWDKLSYTHRREHVEHIEDAKKPETRQRRIEKSTALLSSGQKGPH